jgi:hypothetical protein
VDRPDLNHVYRQAADAAADKPLQWDSPELEELRFKLASSVMGARIKLQDAGFHSAQISSEHEPLVHLHVSKEGHAGIFRLSFPQTGTAPEGQPLYGKKILLTGNTDKSITQFDLYDDDGAIPVDRFETLSQKIAQHVAAECGRKSRPAAAATMGAPA